MECPHAGSPRSPRPHADTEVTGLQHAHRVLVGHVIAGEQDAGRIEPVAEGRHRGILALGARGELEHPVTGAAPPVREALGHEGVDLGEDALLGLGIGATGVHTHAEGLGLELGTVVAVDDRLGRRPELFARTVFCRLARSVDVAFARKPVLRAVRTCQGDRGVVGVLGDDAEIVHAASGDVGDDRVR